MQKQKTKWSPLGIAMFAGYIVLILYSVIPVALHTDFYNSIVMVPLPPDAKSYAELDQITNAKHEEVWFTNKHGDRLNGYLWRCPGAKKVIIYHHGNAGNLSYRGAMARGALDLGSSIFLYDYRGYGKSTGTPTISGLIEDGFCAYNCVTNQLGYKSDAIINYGESIGAGVACAVAEKCPSGGLILQSGVGSLPAVGRYAIAKDVGPVRIHLLGLYPDFLFPYPHMNNMELVKNIHVPIAIIQGALDTTVPVEQAQAMYNNANEPKRLVILQDSYHNAVASERDSRAFVAAVQEILNDKPAKLNAVAHSGS